MHQKWFAPRLSIYQTHCIYLFNFRWFHNRDLATVSNLASEREVSGIRTCFWIHTAFPIWTCLVENTKQRVQKQMAQFSPLKYSLFFMKTLKIIFLWLLAKEGQRNGKKITQARLHAYLFAWGNYLSTYFKVQSESSQLNLTISSATVGRYTCMVQAQGSSEIRSFVHVLQILYF